MTNSSLPQMIHQQDGSVLVIGLLILLVLTIIGTTALNDSMLEEKMAGNFQREVIAFQTAETTMNQMFYRAAQDKPIDENSHEDITQAAIKAGKNTYVEPDNNTFTSEDRKSQGIAKVLYKGSFLPSGGSIGLSKRQFTGEMIEIEATGQVGNAKVTHALGAKKNVPVGK